MKEINPNSKKYREIKNLIKHEDGLYFKMMDNEVSIIEIYGKNNVCFYAFHSKAILYDGSDFIFCASKNSPKKFNRL